MKFLIVMVIIKFAVVLFFLKDYPISNLDDIKNSANQVIDLSVEGFNGFISRSKKSDITMPSSIDKIDLLLDAPIVSPPELTNITKSNPITEKQLELPIDEQADSDSPIVPNFDKKSWAELFQEINKVPPE